MRVVLDANIYLSFILTRGKTIASIFSAWEQEYFDVFASPQIIQEVETALGYPKIKKRISGKDLLDMVSFLERIELIFPRKRVEVLSDPKDNMYLECAAECEADFLVTGDKKHLLPLGKFEGTKIVSPSRFAKILGGKI